MGDSDVTGGVASGQYGVPAGAGTINIGEIKNGQYYDLKEIIQQDSEISLNESGLTFDYTGSENTIRVTKSGTYKIEAWGAQGGSYDDEYTGGLGGYATGTISLTAGDTLYAYVGGTTEKCNVQYCAGGFNGGGRGAGSNHPVYSTGGGGASHIATSSGLINQVLANNPNSVLLVAGGGGGTSYQFSAGKAYTGLGGNGGGIQGNSGTNTQSGFNPGTGGSQLAGGTGNTSGSLGLGADANQYSAGGGGGYYGGGSSNQSGAGGGSGYINTNKLTNAKMVCFNCTESTELETFTESNDCHNPTATSDCAKEGNGYIKITYVGPASSPKLMMSAPKSAPKVIVETPTISIDNTNYAESKTISISYPKGYTSEYSLDLGKTWIEYQGDITVEENITILARSLDENKNIVSTSSFTVNRIDRETPSIELNLEDEITVGSDITLPTGYTSTKSGVTYECKYNDNVISNINELSVGDYEITCDIENGLGKKNTISKIIKIIEEISKEEVSEVNS